MTSVPPVVMGILALSSTTARQLTALGRMDVVMGIAGLLQLCVAAYAIRMNRLFGTARVGWSLFAAFLLLAVLHLLQAFTQPDAAIGIQLDFEVVYTLISLLLLLGMAHLHTVLREQQRTLQEQERREQLEAQMRTQLETEVQKKTAHLNQAIKSLQSEIEVRKQAEARISEQARLLDLTHDAISVQDLDGRILYWNKGAERIGGWTAAEAMGREIAELLCLEKPKYQGAVKQVRETGHWQGETSFSVKSGQTVLMEEDWTLVTDAAGQATSIMVVGADVTEKRKLQTQTLRLQRLESIGTLAGGIAHDLNNVLTPLLVSVEFLKSRCTTGEEQQLLASLQSNVLRGARLVKQILTFGRGVKGDRARVDPATVVQEIRQLMLDSFPKSVELTVQICDGNWSVTGDATQLHQVLLNLCVNARDAMPHGGRLSIDVENVVLNDAYVNRNVEAKPGPHVLIKVTDTGSGIPKSIQNRIFEPFFTTKENGKGTGLGLSTCFTIVKNHGGFINFYSEPANGTVFKVYLPADGDAQPGEVGPVPRANLPKGRNELVLVVDDEQVIREFAQFTLECFGYRILTAANGAEAVSLYQMHQRHIAAVLMDMWMPVMDGPSAVRALKAINRGVVIIGTSGLGEVSDEEVQSSLVHFLAKPYSADSLLLTLDQALHQPTASPVSAASAPPPEPPPGVPAK